MLSSVLYILVEVALFFPRCISLWSSEESVKKKAKINKSSSKDNFERVASDAHPQVFSVAAASVPPSKASAPPLKASAPASKAKPTISIKAPIVYNLMDMVTNLKGGAKAGKSTVPEKAKIQDKNVAAATAVPDFSGSKAKIQDKSKNAAATTLLPLDLRPRSRTRPKLRFSRPLLRPRFRTRTMQEEFLPFDVTFDSVEVAEGSSLACDEVPANTFVMSAQAVEPFVTTANRIRLSQVEEELILQGGDTLYKSLLSSQVKSLATTHASLRQYRELSWMKADRDSLRKDLSILETKVKEKEEALALSNKRLADFSSEKEALSKSAKDFELKVASLDKQVEKLDASLAKVKNDNDDFRGKVDAVDQELVAFAEAEKLRLSGICGQIRDALVSVGSVPDQLPEDVLIEYYQAWLTANIPYVVQACRAFSNNVMHLVVRDLLRSLEAGGIWRPYR
ncbi:hypothetical protein EJB05_22153, partial [Eragrostis curvula]